MPVLLSTSKAAIQDTCQFSWNILDKADRHYAYFSHYPEPLDFSDYGKTWALYAPIVVDRSETTQFCSECKPGCINCEHYDTSSKTAKDRCLKCVDYSNHEPNSNYCSECGKRLK